MFAGSEPPKYLVITKYLFNQKHKETDSWYLVKEIFGDPQNFGGLDPANMLFYKPYTVNCTFKGVGIGVK